MAAPTLSATGVTKRYRSVTALDDVTVEFPAGAITGLLGRNGAGKTTLLRLLAGHELPTAGTVEIAGQDPYENASVLSGIHFARESQHYPGGYRVRHILQAASQIYRGWDAAFAEQLLGDFELPVGRPIAKLSRGMVSALSAIVGLASRAPVTLFDEPYTGLDAVARSLFYDRLLADYAEHPRTIVMSTHLIDEISELVEHVVLLDRGRLTLVAPTESFVGAAMVVSGPGPVVDQLLANHDDPSGHGLTVLDRQEIVGRAHVTLTGAAAAHTQDRARELGLDVRPVALQELFVHTTTNPTAREQQ